MPFAAAEMITAGVQAATERREQAQRTEADAARLQYLSAALFYPDLLLRAPPAQIAGGAPVLWAHGVSGDRSIVLARLGRSEHLALATQLDDAQRWWRQIGLDVDVVAVTAARGRGDADLAASLGAVKNAARESSGQFFVLRESDLTAVQRDGLAAAARIVLDDEGGDLAAQLRTRWDRSARCRLGPPIAAPRPMHRRTMPTGPADHSNSSMAWAALQMTAGSTS